MLPKVRGSTVPGTGLSASSPSTTEVNDLVLVFTWSTDTTIPTHTLDAAGGYVEIRSHSHDDGTTDGRLSVAYRIATSAGAQTYQAYTGGGAVNYTGLVIITRHSYDVSTLPASNSSTLTTNAVPNPPSVTALTGDFLVFATGAWNSASAAAAITPPTNYNEVWELAGTVVNELSTATRGRVGLNNATEDPGAFGDNITPNGSASMTFALKGSIDLGLLLGGVSAG